jgi:hypothetical protein
MFIRDTVFSLPIAHSHFSRRLFQQPDFVFGQHLVNVQKDFNAALDFGHAYDLPDFQDEPPGLLCWFWLACR